MILSTIKKEIEEAVLLLLERARQMTRNEISSNCRFILTEIKDSRENFHAQQKLLIRENNKKQPLTLTEIMPELQSLFDNLYDINLHIYKSGRDFTIIDIRYYLKSSLDQGYRQEFLQNPPMLHSKIAIPPWLSDSKERFDINWEHRQWLIRWKLWMCHCEIQTLLREKMIELQEAKMRPDPRYDDDRNRNQSE